MHNLQHAAYICFTLQWWTLRLLQSDTADADAQMAEQNIRDALQYGEQMNCLPGS